MNGVKGYVRMKSEEVLGVGGSLRVMVENDEVMVVGQEYLPILLALDRRVPVVEQTQVIVGLRVFGSPYAQFLNCW